jgi:hypothetical protein
MAAVIVLLSRGTTTYISGWESDSKGGCKIEKIAFLVTEMDEEKLIFEGNGDWLSIFMLRGAKVCGKYGKKESRGLAPSPVILLCGHPHSLLLCCLFREVRRKSATDRYTENERKGMASS